MKKKILFIDLFCGFGHNNINRIYINKFLEEGYDVHIAMKKSYFETLGIDNEFLQLELPESLFKNTNSKILYRFNQIKLLWYISEKTNTLDYSFYFFTYFDEIAFYLSWFRRSSYLMVHGNTESLYVPFKFFFLRRLSKIKKVNFVVFLDGFKKLFILKGIDNVLVSSHGLPVFEENDSKIERLLFTDLIKMINCSFIEPRIIFVPNASKFGDTSINDLINHQAFVELIEKKNIILVLKGKPYSKSKHRIFYLPPYVDETYFKALLRNSFVVLLNYPLSFQFRVSGLFFECMASNIPLVVTKIFPFMHYSKNFNYNPYYGNLDELVSRIDFLTTVDSSFNPYKDLNAIEPSIREIF